MTITATELKSNLGKYLDEVSSGNAEISISKNGRVIALLSNPNAQKIASLEKLASLLQDKRSSDNENIRENRINEKYGEYFDRY